MSIKRTYEWLLTRNLTKEETKRLCSYTQAMMKHFFERSICTFLLDSNNPKDEGLVIARTVKYDALSKLGDQTMFFWIDEDEFLRNDDAEGFEFPVSASSGVYNFTGGHSEVPTLSFLCFAKSILKDSLIFSLPKSAEEMALWEEANILSCFFLVPDKKNTPPLFKDIFEGSTLA